MAELKTKLKAHIKMGGIRHKEVYDNIKRAVIDFNLLLKIYENQDDLNQQEYRYFAETYGIYVNFNNDSLEDYYKVIFGDFKDK